MFKKNLSQASVYYELCFHVHTYKLSFLTFPLNSCKN